MSTTEWHQHATQIFASEHAMIDAAAHELTAVATDAVRTRGRCALAVDVSTLCVRLYRRWVTSMASHTFWPYTLIFAVREAPSFADATVTHTAESDFLGALAASQARVFEITRPEPTESSEAVAWRYERLIRMALELRPNERPTFDLLLLDLERPGEVMGRRADEWSDVDSPKLVHVPHSQNASVSLTPSAITSTRRMVVVASHAQGSSRRLEAREGDFLPPALGLPAALADLQALTTILLNVGN